MFLIWVPRQKTSGRECVSTDLSVAKGRVISLKAGWMDVQSLTITLPGSWISEDFGEDSICLHVVSFLFIIQSNIFIHQGLPPKWRELQENQKDLAVWYSRVLRNILIKRYGNWCCDIARINQKDEHIWRTSSNACFLLTLLFRSFQAQNVLGRNVRLLTFGVSLDI